MRSLTRGLDILRWIYRNGAATLHELHVGLSLPKPTLLRLLATLEASGFIWHGMEDRRYHAAHLAKVATKARANDQLAEVAGPVLDQLMAKIRWPSDLSVRKANFMQLLESSRQRSYFELGRVEVGFHIDMLLSAPGRAYLAFCPEREGDSLISRLEKCRSVGFQVLGSTSAIARVIEETQRRGYALRDTRWGGHPSKPKQVFDDGLMAIAVPIISGGKVLGCVNIVWIARVLKYTDIVRLHLDDLKGAAVKIASSYEEVQRSPIAL